MFINPFVSIEEHLKSEGYIRQYEGPKGFIYAKNVGGGYIYIAEASKNPLGFGMRFYDPDFSDRAAWVTEKELRLFSRKLKEWKEQYENKNNK